MGSEVWTWRRLLAVTLARSVVVGLLGLAGWAAVPAVIGWHPTTVSSGSMMPRLHVGDIAVSRPLAGLAPPIGTVLLYDDPDHPGRLRMHRFIRLQDDGLMVTRGDANPAEDSTPIGLDAVRGIGTLRVPWIGLPIVWLREGDWVPLGLVASGLVGVLLVAASGRDRTFDDEAGDGPSPDGPDDPDDGSPEEGRRTEPDVLGWAWERPAAALRTVARPATVALLAVALTVVVPAPAGAVFRTSTAGRVGLGANPWFTCASAVASLAPSVWYRMDETSSLTTAAADGSGNGRTGTYTLFGKTSTTSRACVRDSGRAMTFNGSSGSLSSPSLGGPLPNTFTLSVWFRTTTRAGGKLIGFGNAASGASTVMDRHVYMTNAGQLVFGVYPGAVRTVTSPGTYNDNAWHLAVATLSSAGMQLRVDGDLVGSDPGVTSAEPASSGYLRVGYDNLDGWPSVPSSRWFAGTLDDAALFPTALSAAQVDGLWEAGT